MGHSEPENRAHKNLLRLLAAESVREQLWFTNFTFSLILKERESLTDPERIILVNFKYNQV